MAKKPSEWPTGTWVRHNQQGFIGIVVRREDAAVEDTHDAFFIPVLIKEYHLSPKKYTDFLTWYHRILAAKEKGTFLRLPSTIYGGPGPLDSPNMLYHADPDLLEVIDFKGNLSRLNKKSTRRGKCHRMRMKETPYGEI